MIRAEGWGGLPRPPDLDRSDDFTELARGETHPAADPATRRLYMLDESSLAGTRQTRAFLDKLNPEARVLVIGDIRQQAASGRE